MSGTVNRVILIANVGKDPEIRTMENGKKVANLSVATTETWKNREGEKQEKTEWHRVTVFNEGLVNVLENYVGKGDKLYLEGQLQTRKWQDKDGQDKYSTEIVLQGFDSKLVMLSDKKRESHVGREEARRGGDDGQDIAY